jgi:hypothetical protein
MVLTAEIVGYLMLTSFRRHLVIVVLTTASLFMSLLIVQQAHTIDSQRMLIRQLFKDSMELNAMKIKQVQESIKK